MRHRLGETQQQHAEAENVIPVFAARRSHMGTPPFASSFEQEGESNRTAKLDPVTGQCNPRISGVWDVGDPSFDDAPLSQARLSAAVQPQLVGPQLRSLAASQEQSRHPWRAR